MTGQGKLTRLAGPLMIGLLLWQGASAAPTAPAVSYGVDADTFHPVKEQHGMV